MALSPDWLPRLVTLGEYDGVWKNYLDAIYEIFCNDFVNSKPRYAEKRFALKRHPVTNGREATFWHLISEGKVEGDRVPDLRRCERMPWPRPLIEAMGSGKVHVWKNKRRGNNRVVIAIDDFSYVVILDDRKEFVLLLTAYVVERNHMRKKLEKECSAWKKQAGKS